MSTLDLNVSLPVASQPKFDDFVEQGVLAENLGFDHLWMSETWGRNAVSVISVLTERTDEIGLGTSILPIYSRSPALMGQTAATLQESSGGRFRLGVGSSSPTVVEGWHGVDYERPLRRKREYIEIIKEVVRGGEVNYDGDIFDLAGFNLRFTPPSPPSVEAAGLGPKAVELAGRFADGWHAVLFTPESYGERYSDLQRGMELGGRTEDDIRTNLMLTCCALDDETRARKLARQHAAFYIGAMGTYYRDSLARQGYEETAYHVHVAWWNGDKQEAIDSVTDELLDALAAAGSPEKAKENLRRFAEIDELDEITLLFPRGATAEEVEETMEKMSPENMDWNEEAPS
ncbi:MAG: TIGR04024 family LLM class F420-dependent oxidoreductase [Halobacteria archaeon]